MSPAILDSYRAVTATGSRGDLDRTVLVQQVESHLAGSDDRVDREIRYSVGLIDAYEQVSGLAESAFRSLMWALTRRGGRSTADELLGDSIVASHLTTTRRQLTAAAQRLQSQLSDLNSHPQVREAVSADRLDQLMQDALNGQLTERDLVDAVMARHRRVQQQKRKGLWIEQDHPYWTLLPGFGDNSDAPSAHEGAYLHPFRVSNAYSMLRDLGKVRGAEVPDGEEE